LALVKQGKRTEAIGHLERAAALDVNDPWAPVVLAEIAIHQRRLAQATDHAKVALDRAPKNGRVLLLNGVVARIRKQYARALEMLDRAITSTPRNAAAYAERGYVRHQMGHVNEAISDLETARTFNAREKRVRAWLPVALTRRAVSLLRAGDSKLAGRDLRRALGIRPNLMEAAWNLALLHDRSGDLVSAQRVVRSALQHQSKQSDLHLLSAYLYVRNRDYEAAQIALQKTVNATDVGLRWLVQGAVHGHFQEFDAAIAAVQQARVHGIEVGDALTMARSDKAVDLLQRKRTQAALVELQRMKPETRSAYEHIRVSLLAYAHLVADHGYGKALKLLKSITKHSAANRWGVESFLADVHLLIGYVRYRLGNERDAVPSLKRHLSKKPRDAMARRLMAATLDSLAERDHAARRFSKADVMEREAAKYAPNNARIRHNVACIQYGRGEYKEAATVFRALKNHADVPEAPLNLALFLDDIAGKGAEAVALYRSYIQSDGSAREIARRRLERKERILGL
jgi:Tfp pilus assembly protein PilF